MVQRVCPSCSALSETDKSFCPECGTAYVRSSGGGASSGSSGGGLATTGLVFGILAIIGGALAWFLSTSGPALLGIIGLIFGGIAWKKGQPRGKTATIVSIIGVIVCLVVR